MTVTGTLETSSTVADSSTVVGRQQWKDLDVPPLGSWTPSLTVAVVIPARDSQEELDRTLASLAQQSYPSRLTEVLVVDDASAMPLRLPRVRPKNTQLTSLDEAAGYGAGRARHAGATTTASDVLLFLDGDMVVDRRHVEAHARWHHVTPHAVVLAHKWFVDFSGLTPTDVAEATSAGRLDGLLVGRERRRHEWHEDFIAEHGDLTYETSDIFVTVVGSSVSTRAELYRTSGGFAPFGLRGISDTEFGYRAFIAGGLLVPDPQAITYHQGLPSFALHGDRIKRLRSGLAANYLPIDLFRPSNTGRQWAVPMVQVVVDVGVASPEEVQVTTDSVLASEFTDLVVTVTTEKAEPLPQWVIDYFSHDSRVTFTSDPVTSGFPSPISVAISAGLVVDADAIRCALRRIHERGIGLLRTDPGELGGLAFEVWSTRAVLRATYPSRVNGLQARVSELFGERWATGDTLGVRKAKYGITKQGMIAPR